MVKRKAKEMQQAAEPKKDDKEQQEGEELEPSDSDAGDSQYSDKDEDSDGSDDSAPDVSDEGEEDSPDEDPFDQIDVNFEFFDPKEQDFHGLKAMLHTFLDGQQYDNSQLVDTIIAQVGHLMVYGAAPSAITVRYYREASFLRAAQRVSAVSAATVPDRSRGAGMLEIAAASSLSSSLCVA